MDFTEFNLDGQLLKGIEAAGYKTCTEVQEQVLKTSQDGSDLYVQSQTGTGKTAAYLVAIIQEMLSKEENKGKKALILVPTRELAVQVEEEAKTLAEPAGLKAFSFYGGVGYEKQIAAIQKGVDIIVSTPGRLIDLQEGKNISLSDVAFLVCDEADRMFDMGFYPDLRKILTFIPKSEERQTMLFSATLNSYVKNLAWEYTRDPKEIEIACENITVSEIDQELLHVSSDEKMKLLIGILKNEAPASVIIFCNTKRTCEVVSKRLEINGLKNGFLIGDLPQKRRLQILNDFKAGTLTMLVATDVAARGIDVNDLAMVINYDLPNEAENYVHRIGRTARAGKSGKAYTFCSEQDVYNLPAIERYIEMQIPAKVAYPEQMLEDASAGIYIKTENWHDDDEMTHGGYRSGRHDSYRKKDGSGGKYRSDSRSSGGKSKEHGSRKNGDFKKDGYKQRNGSSSYNKNSPKKEYSGANSFRQSKQSLDEMESLSFEERMKIYKDKYSGGKAASASYSKNSRNGKKGAYNASSKGGKPSRKYDDRGRTGAKNGSARNGNGKNSRNYTNGSSSVQRPEQKKGFFARIKSFFGR